MRVSYGEGNFVGGGMFLEVLEFCRCISSFSAIGQCQIFSKEFLYVILLISEEGKLSNLFTAVLEILDIRFFNSLCVI